MVMVVDEFGGTAGLVTLKDLIAEIIGDTAEPENTEEPAIQFLDEQTFLVQAQMNLEEVNELLDLHLPLTDEYQTLGGFLLYQLQKIPVPGETLNYENLELTVESSEGPRLHQIRIHRQEPAATEQEENTVSDIEPGTFTNGNSLSNDTVDQSERAKEVERDVERDRDSNPEKF
jgi:CBS domain containing-hemolysin-like protein